MTDTTPGYDLLAETVKLLRTTDLSIPDLRKQTGFSHGFLYRLRDGEPADNAPISKIQRLHDFLIDRAEEVEAAQQASA